MGSKLERQKCNKDDEETLTHMRRIAEEIELIEHKICTDVWGECALQFPTVLCSGWG